MTEDDLRAECQQFIHDVANDRTHTLLEMLMTFARRMQAEAEKT